MHVLAHACNFSTRKVKAGESGVQGHPQLYVKFEVNPIGDTLKTKIGLGR